MLWSNWTWIAARGCSCTRIHGLRFRYSCFPLGLFCLWHTIPFPGANERVGIPPADLVARSLVRQWMEEIFSNNACMNIALIWRKGNITNGSTQGFLQILFAITKLMNESLPSSFCLYVNFAILSILTASYLYHHSGCFYYPYYIYTPIICFIFYIILFVLILSISSIYCFLSSFVNIHIYIYIYDYKVSYRTLRPKL